MVAFSFTGSFQFARGNSMRSCDFGFAAGLVVFAFAAGFAAGFEVLEKWNDGSRKTYTREGSALQIAPLRPKPLGFDPILIEQFIAHSEPQRLRIVLLTAPSPVR